MTVNHLYPTTRPTLDLNFARQKRLDPRVTFTRGSTATYVGDDGLIKTAASNEARFDHDPATGESLGLLIEESRTNYFQDSDSNTTSKWNPYTGVTITQSTTIAPDGSTNAIRIEATTSGQYAERYWVAPSTGTYTATIYIRSRTGADQNVRLDFSGAQTTIQTVPASGEWVRLRDTQGGTVGSGGRYFYVHSLNTETLDVDVWGEQVELGSFATSYIPTPSGSTVTRSADVASMTGTNFSSWYNQSEGTTVSNARTFTPTGTDAYIYGYSGAGSSERMEHNARAYFQFLIYDTSGTEYNQNTANYTQNQTSIAAFAYKLNSANSSLDGTLGTEDTSVNLVTPNEINIGTRFNSALPLNGHLSRFTYYPTRLTDSQLQELTR